MKALSSLLGASFLSLALLTSPAQGGIDKVYQKPESNKSWGATLSEFVGSLVDYNRSSKSYALVIGVSEYTNGYSSLPTSKDAKRMRDYLLHEAGFDYVHLLTEDKVTHSRLRKLMVDDFPGRVETNDRFLFYWSGHGVQRKVGQGHIGYLPLGSSSKEFSSMVSMDHIARWDGLITGKQALFLLDACFSGLAGKSSKKNTRRLVIDQLSRPSHHLLAAGTGEEETIAGDKWGGSLFTTAIIDGLRGSADASSAYPRDGVVSLSELVSYVKFRVADEKIQANWKKGITPQLRDLQTSIGEFFFVTNEHKATRLRNQGVAVGNEFRHGIPVAKSPSRTPAPSDRTVPATPALSVDRDALFWNSIKDSDDADMFQEYLRQHPNGGFAGLARLRIKKLKAAKQLAAVALPKPAPSPVKPAVGVFPKRPGEVFRDCADCPEMVVIPAGSFRMGDLSGSGDKEEKPVHRGVTPEKWSRFN